ncbi:MAG: GH116 family glycosyl hydrolase, partial [Planctomycetota bacterium]
FESAYQSDYGGTSTGVHYADPPRPGRPGRFPAQHVTHGFALRIRDGAGGSSVRTLDETGFRDVSFRGEWPIGRVAWRDEACPIEAQLEAFSPFIPLDADDSALPATIMRFTLRNRADADVDVDVAGYLENAVLPGHGDEMPGRRVNRLIRGAGRTTVAMTAESPPAPAPRPPRGEIVFATFEGDRYEGWTAAGTAFGAGPFARADMAAYHDVGNHAGDRVVNSHQTRAGEDVRQGDAHTGTLTSDPFVIRRRFVNFRIGGGRHPGRTCINLLVDGAVVRTATGHDANRMRAETFDVSALEGRTGVLQIVDAVEGPWGNIGIDQVVFSDEPVASRELERQPGYGSMALTLLGEGSGRAAVDRTRLAGEALFDDVLSGADAAPRGETTLADRPVGAVGRTVRVAAGRSETVEFVITWWFPYYREVRGEFAAIQDIGRLNRHYENRFAGASAVAAYVARNRRRLVDTTLLWSRTWYESTLPYWLLDRAFTGIDCLATQTCHWFDNGRFWGWEGVTCCPGTCQHVWNYAQGLARVFPRLERTTREIVDYGLSFQEDGSLWYRGECARHVAHDGQLGTIIRAYREHATAPDDAFLKRIWPRVRRSLEHMIEQDADGDGLLEGTQYNTLDQAWVGPMGWISSMYLAALAAGRTMAGEMGDDAFARRCETILESGRRAIVDELFNGEYFIHRPPHFESTNTNDGCHIDQVLGQSLAWQVGLPRVVARPEVESALRSLWRFNFAPDAGGYRNAMQEVIGGGRWYAMPGEAGLLMCTWPRGGAERAAGSGRTFSWAVGYFNECMNGFEYQAAAHMIYEGAPGSELVRNGLAITRAVHDRYAAERRNPYNEIECSDHYSRSMAGYGVFLACCGFAYHGPKGHVAFAPRVGPEDFRAAFTAAEGWGSYAQRLDDRGLRAVIEVRHGRLRLRTIGLALDGDGRVRAAAGATVNGRAAVVRPGRDGVIVELGDELVLGAGETVEVVVST